MPSKKSGKEECTPKSFWLILGILFLVSGAVVIMSLLSSGPAIVTGSAIQNIAYAKEGTPLSIGVNDVEGVSRLDFTALAIIKEGKIIVEPLTLTREPFTGIAYNRFQITSPQADAFGPLTITLKLEEKKLQELKLAAKDVTLYLDGEPLATELLKNDHGYVSYQALAPTVGQFVIGKAAPAAELPVEEPKAVEEALPLPEVPVEQPLVGKSAEQLPEEKVGFFARIWNFLKGLFS
ncbi:MAG: hypothetical protein Q8R53_04280 [Nanoarchaeota archaeon]|nr:hypothetical protein [Nanoarchaeota archaeon]